MDDQLRKALLQGKEDYEKRMQAERDKVAQETTERLRKEREREDIWRRKIREEPALLFEKIQQAKADGKDCVVLGYGDLQLVNALKEIEGLTVTWEESYKHINSDEIKEHCFWITVKWRDLP
jgi:hypothetical protein